MCESVNSILKDDPRENIQEQAKLANTVISVVLVLLN